MEEENKILLTSLSSIDDNNIHEVSRSEQARIIQKRKEQQQPPIKPIFMDNIFGIGLDESRVSIHETKSKNHYIYMLVKSHTYKKKFHHASEKAGHQKICN